jgi:hypothetical protein
VIPELPVRRVVPQRGAPRVRRPASTQLLTGAKRKTVVELVAVGIVDLVLIVAMFHPAFVRSIFTSMPMTITSPTATLTTATSWGGA